MKPIPLLITILCAAALAAAGIQTTRLSQQSRETAQLRENAAKSAEETRQDAEKVSALNEKVAALNAESAALRERLEALRATQPAVESAAASPSPSPDEKDGLQGMFKNMFKDPAMRKAMAKQQMVAMRQFYGDLIKSLHLSPQEADQFFDLLGQRQMAMMDKGMAMMQKDGAGAGTETPQQDTSDQALKNFLGGRYEQFQSYEKSLPDRIQLQQLNQQLSSSGIGLNDSQSQGLLQIMADERTKMPSAFPASDPAAGQKALAGITADAEQTLMQNEAEMNQRIRTRAMSILTPQQLSAMESAQNQWLDLQKAGMEMARKMFPTGKQ